MEYRQCLEDDGTVPQAVLKNLAEAVGGHYHCYSPESEVSCCLLLSPSAAWCRGPWAKADQPMYSLPSHPQAHGHTQV